MSIKHWGGFPGSRGNECRTIKHHSARVAGVSFPRNDADIWKTHIALPHRPRADRHPAPIRDAEGTRASAILDPLMTSQAPVRGVLVVRRDKGFDEWSPLTGRSGPALLGRVTTESIFGSGSIDLHESPSTSRRSFD